MPVRRIASAAGLAAPVAARKPSLQLPESKKPMDLDIRHYKGLFYGREKIGKTSFLAKFPDILFLTTEPGTQGLSIYEFNSENGGCTSWEVIREAVDLLVASDRFAYVVFDTIDKAYEMCLDFVCKQEGIAYPGMDAAGREDWGRSWTAVKKEFSLQIHRLVKTGRGVYFTSHVKEEEVRTKSGDAYTRIYPSMPKQARTVIEALVDFFFYAEYVSIGTETQRVFFTQGDELIWAGHREPAKFPRVLPMDKEFPFEVFQQGFLGQHPGIDIHTISSSRLTPKVTQDFVKRQKLADASSQT